MKRRGGLYVPRTPVVRVATPTRGMVTDEHKVGLLTLVMDLMQQDAPWAFEAVDSCRDHLVTARNVLLHRALHESRADVLLWVDADVAPMYSDPRSLWDFLDFAAQANHAIVGALACRRTGGETGGGGLNIPPAAAMGARGQLAAGAPTPVTFVGHDFVAYNLAWWRRQRLPRLEPGGDVGPVDVFRWTNGRGEDWHACQLALEYGGDVWAWPAMPTWHDGAVFSGVGDVRLRAYAATDSETDLCS